MNPQKDTIAIESRKNNPYINVIAVIAIRTRDQDNPLLAPALLASAPVGRNYLMGRLRFAGILGVLAFMIALMGAPSRSDPTMAQMQWHRRVLIVSTPNAKDPKFLAQQLALSQWTGGDDRDLSIVRIEGDTVSGSSETAAELRDRYRLQAATFSVALVGKDGHVAVRSQVPLTGVQLQADIDAMPMRKAGQR